MNIKEQISKLIEEYNEKQENFRISDSIIKHLQDQYELSIFDEGALHKIQILNISGDNIKIEYNKKILEIEEAEINIDRNIAEDYIYIKGDYIVDLDDIIKKIKDVIAYINDNLEY